MKKIIFLMGPTASGKTPLAVSLVQQLPLDIISVDSAMIYRGMDIGTAKPTADILKIAPHRLIDIVEPNESYSAGRFREEALREIEDIIVAGKTPLLVGGTMMYFRILMQGMAALPRADESIRAAIKARADQSSWAALHAELANVDPKAAARIHANDAQRISRALEVFQLTGTPITTLQQEATSPLAGFQIEQFAITPSDRAILHDRIAKRFDAMLEEGFMDEVKKLYARGDLTTVMPSVRSVGYRQAWSYLEGEIDFDTMREQAIAATRQLAKRQLTWLRSWPDIAWLNSGGEGLVERICRMLEG